MSIVGLVAHGWAPFRGKVPVLFEQKAADLPRPDSLHAVAIYLFLLLDDRTELRRRFFYNSFA